MRVRYSFIYIGGPGRQRETESQQGARSMVSGRVTKRAPICHLCVVSSSTNSCPPPINMEPDVRGFHVNWCEASLFFFLHIKSQKESHKESSSICHLFVAYLYLSPNVCLSLFVKLPRSSSRELRVRVPFFSVADFSRGTLPQRSW